MAVSLDAWKVELELAAEHEVARALLLQPGALDADLPDLAAAGTFQRADEADRRLFAERTGQHHAGLVEWRAR